ncbi:MAG: Dabb family protein [bacterium]|nr:Dabb family protein [bacterium]
MQIHIALFRWKPGVAEKKIGETLRAIEKLKGKIPDIVEIRCGKNSSKHAAGYTHVVLVRGLNKKAIEAYRMHPDHEKAARIIETMEEHSIGVDFATQDP